MLCFFYIGHMQRSGCAIKKKEKEKRDDIHFRIQNQSGYK